MAQGQSFRFLWPKRYQNAEADSAFLGEKRTLQEQGYWACYWHHLDTAEGKWSSFWHLGPRGQDVTVHNAEGQAVKKTTIRHLNRYFKSLLTEADNAGFPFASIQIDSMGQDSQGRWHWYYSRVLGPQFTWDTLAVSGTLAVNSSWLARYLQMVSGKTYQGRKAPLADKALRSLPWVQWRAPTKLSFAGTEAFPIIQADARPANQADGIIGIMPNERRPGAVLINGEVNLKLNNLFQRGKQFVGEWRQIDPTQQRLLVSYRHPVIAGLPWEAGLQFFLLRQDSSFLQRHWRIDLQYLYGNGHKIGIIWAEQASQLLGATQSTANTDLVASTIFRQYGLQWEWQQLDDYFYPKSGIYQCLELQLGTKTLTGKPNTDLNLPTQSLQWSINLNHSRYISLNPKQNLLLRGQSRFLINDQLQRNELFRVGGLTTLRGFNENTFFAAQYGILTTEYRYYTEATTFLSLFIDQGWVRDQTFRGVSEDYPTGIGAGASFKTGPGIFTLNYALGRREGSPFRWQDAKIHFGLTARF